MSNNVWFKRKQYGWGWYPSTWQGWGILLLYIIFIVWILKDLEEVSYSLRGSIVDFAIPFLIATVVLILVCYLKGEEPRWQWGEDKNNNEHIKEN